MSTAEVIARHESAGQYFEAGGIKSFMRAEGSGPPVVCMHGVPTSSFLYRKVVPELAARGLRGIAFDLPGLGLADRPKDFDYTWSGLGRFAVAAVGALGLSRFHLVVHDIGGPVGFELAHTLRDRILSLTVLNTVIDVDTLKRPWTMQPFAIPVIRWLWLWSLNRPLFLELMYLQGIKDRNASSKDEIAAHLELLRRGDGGAAFLEIMGGFERTPEKRALYRSTLSGVPYPVQVVWGEDDPALTIGKFGEIARDATGLEKIHRVPAKHFLQEDQAPAVAAHIAELAMRASPAA